jgi:hypothetical protein
MLFAVAPIEITSSCFVVKAELGNNIMRTDPGFLIDDPACSIDFVLNSIRCGIGDSKKRMRYAASVEQLRRKIQIDFQIISPKDVIE